MSNSIIYDYLAVTFVQIFQELIEGKHGHFVHLAVLNVCNKSQTLFSRQLLTFNESHRREPSCFGLEMGYSLNNCQFIARITLIDTFVHYGQFKRT